MPQLEWSLQKFIETCSRRRCIACSMWPPSPADCGTESSLVQCRTRVVTLRDLFTCVVLQSSLPVSETSHVLPSISSFSMLHFFSSARCRSHMLTSHLMVPHKKVHQTRLSVFFCCCTFMCFTGPPQSALHCPSVDRS